MPQLFRFKCNDGKRFYSNHDLEFVRNIYGDEINHLNARSIWICTRCRHIHLSDILYDMGNISDGYHTFNQLYHHRAILFSVICNQFKDKCWKSKKHYDGSMYKDMFIVGIETPKGLATYHYDINLYWGIFDVKEIDRAPEWDGHTSEDAIERIASLRE